MSIDDGYIYLIQIEALLGTETGIYRMRANQTRRTDEVVCVWVRNVVEKGFYFGATRSYLSESFILLYKITDQS